MGGMKTLGRPSDRIDTHCKRCRLGIFNKQQREWQRLPVPGLVHVDCDNPNGDGK